MTLPDHAARPTSTPEQIQSRLGSLEFFDGVPTVDTVETVYDHLDFVHALNVFLDGYAGAFYVRRPARLPRGRRARQHGPDLLRAHGLESEFLTANADTVYFLAAIDLTSGPMVVQTPPQALGVFDDMWWGWIVDFGLSGPDRGEGGRFLLVPPGYDGPLPDSGYHVGHSRTSRALMLGRAFLTDDDPAPTVATIKGTLRITPWMLPVDPAGQWPHPHHRRARQRRSDARDPVRLAEPGRRLASASQHRGQRRPGSVARAGAGEHAAARDSRRSATATRAHRAAAAVLRLPARAASGRRSAARDQWRDGRARRRRGGDRARLVHGDDARRGRPQDVCSSIPGAAHR